MGLRERSGARENALPVAVAVALLAAGGCGSSSHCTSGAACLPANPCHQGTLACVGSTPTCQDDGNNLADGTVCGNRATCLSGVCTDGGTGTDGGCPGPVVDCGVGRTQTCLSDDPDNCGDCGITCPTGRCRQGTCFGCRAGDLGDCPAGEYCADAYCGKPCTFALEAGAEPACDAGLCRPFQSSDPPLVNVGICTPAGEPSDPGLGAACVGPCSGSMDCVADEVASGGAACASICDATRAGSCPSGWGCAAALDPEGVYLGYGYCQPITAGQSAAGAACSSSVACQPGTQCVGGLLPDGGLGCGTWCDPLADGGCSGGSCALYTSASDVYARIGLCRANQPGTRTLGESCSLASQCVDPLYCTEFQTGTYFCLEPCDPWAANCPAGSGCVPLILADNDFLGLGVCYQPPAGSQPEFGSCDVSTQNCAPGLSCLLISDEDLCVQHCDPFSPATCPPTQRCFAVPDALNQFSGVGVCNGEVGTKHAGDTCTNYGDCISGDCYLRQIDATSGTCIQACALGSAFGCAGGSCADGGFGNGLGYCVLADGGRWD